MLQPLVFVMLAASSPGANSAPPPASPAASRPAASKDALPPAVRRYAATLAATRTLAVDVTRLDDQRGEQPFPGGFSALLAFERPNRLRLDFSTGNKPVEHLVSDGITVTRWSDKRLSREPAPPSLEGIAPVAKKGEPFIWAAGLFTMPSLITSLEGLRDEGPETVDGVQARRIVGQLYQAVDPGHTAPTVTLWLAEDTGWPVRLRYERSDLADGPPVRHMRFSRPRLGPLPPGTFVANVTPATREDRSPLYQDDPALPPGDKAPPFSLRTIGGKKVSLAQFRGRPVLVEFWAPWCPGCRQGMPWVRKVEREYAPQGLAVISVSTTAKKEDLEKYLAERPKADVIAVHDPAEMDAAVGYAKYKITGFPSFVLVGRDGRVVSAWKGYWDGFSSAQFRAALSRAGLAPGGSP